MGTKIKDILSRLSPIMNESFTNEMSKNGNVDIDLVKEYEKLIYRRPWVFLCKIPIGKSSFNSIEMLSGMKIRFDIKELITLLYFIQRSEAELNKMFLFEKNTFYIVHYIDVFGDTRIIKLLKNSAAVINIEMLEIMLSYPQNSRIITF